ncbi:Reticulon-like protein B2 [Capsicum annuum]|uniref:Reticulon-like protein n=1 Tax=Capsicum annuum TaxID=4072 RepID=A0A2G2YT31_CAPAN|nr:Reticulon-like protein B2 [Capsicum annuum]
MSDPVEEIVPESSAKGSLAQHDYSSSPSTDGDGLRRPTNDKSHLFGRQKPVHAALGGGKPADILLWRNKQISAGMLTAATVIWLLFEWIGYHLLTFICHSLILTLAILFFWSNISHFVNKTPMEFPEIVLPEKLWTQVALLLRDRFNWAFGVFWEVASGKDLKKFLYTIVGLWIVSIVGSWFDFLTLFYILPWFYEKHEDQVDTYAQKAKKELKRQYSHLDEKVLQKLPKVPFVKDSKQQ